MSHLHYDIEIRCFNQPPRTQTITAPSITIGGQSGDIVIGDPQASTPHAQLLTHEGRVWLRDSGTLNGTFVNGQRVTEVALSVDAVVQIGQSSLRLLAVYPSATPQPSPGQLRPGQPGAVQPSAAHASTVPSASQPGAVVTASDTTTEKRGGKKIKWFHITALLVVVALVGVPFLPYRVVRAMSEDSEGFFVASSIQWWYGVWNGDRISDLEEWAYGACECTEFTCMKSRSLEFLALVKEHGDGESITLASEDAGWIQDFEKGAKCLNDIVVKTFEDQSAAMCACTDAACAQRERVALDELLKSVADLRSIGSEDVTPTVNAAVAAGVSCVNDLAATSPSQECQQIEKVSLAIKPQMAEILKNLPTAGKQASYEKSAIVFEGAANGLAALVPTMKDPALKPVLEQYVVTVQATVTSYRTRASLVESGSAKAQAKAKEETSAIYVDMDRAYNLVNSVCQP